MYDETGRGKITKHNHMYGVSADIAQLSSLDDCAIVSSAYLVIYVHMFEKSSPMSSQQLASVQQIITCIFN